MKIRRINSVVLPIIAVNVAFYIVSGLLPGITKYLILDSSKVLTMPWMLVTHMFMHANFNHIFWNMYGIFMFGTFLEKRIGWKQFLMLYFGAGIAAGFVSVLAYPLTHSIFPSLYPDPIYRALGASAALFGVIGALIILMPDLRLLFFFIIPMPLWIAGIIWALLDVFGFFFLNGVGNVAHLVGLSIGLLAGLYLKHKKKRYYRRFSSKSHLNMNDLDDYLQSGRI